MWVASDGHKKAPPRQAGQKAARRSFPFAPVVGYEQQQRPHNRPRQRLHSFSSNRLVDRVHQLRPALRFERWDGMSLKQLDRSIRSMDLSNKPVILSRSFASAAPRPSLTWSTPRTDCPLPRARAISSFRLNWQSRDRANTQRARMRTRYHRRGAGAFRPRSIGACLWLDRVHTRAPTPNQTSKSPTPLCTAAVDLNTPHRTTCRQQAPANAAAGVAAGAAPAGPAARARAHLFIGRSIIQSPDPASPPAPHRTRATAGILRRWGSPRRT